MKNLHKIVCAILVFVIIMAGCGKIKGTSSIISDDKKEFETAKIATSENHANKDDNLNSGISQDTKDTIDKIYNSLYIGEAFKSGNAYLEPFGMSRGIGDEKPKFSGYSKITKLYDINGQSNASFPAVFESEFNTYVPNVEKESRYFYQGFSNPSQYGLKYRLNAVPKESTIAISLMGYDIKDSDLSVSGKKRQYSKEEYASALSEVNKDKQIPESSRTLRYMTIDDTIVGAEELALLSIKGSDIKLLVSKYNTHGFEYASVVYVVDFIKDGKVLATYEKYNTDGPY